MQNRGNPEPRKVGSKNLFFINARNWSIRAIEASKQFFIAKKNREAIFFGVDRQGAFSKKRTPKAEKNDWLRALIKKRTPKAEKNDWLRALIKKRSAEGGKLL